jgi:phosphatidylinositol alpha-1,6-mannosyltransferase
MLTAQAPTTLLITKIFPPKVGGRCRWLWELYRRLPRQEYVIAAGEDPRDEEFDDRHDLRVVRAPLTLPERKAYRTRALKSYWRALRAVDRTARLNGVGRVHCGACVPEGWLALLLKWRYGLPYLCYVHGEEVKLASAGGGRGAMSSRQLRWMTWGVLREAKFAIANSLNTARILRHEWNLPPERIRIMYPGVDTGLFMPASNSMAVRKELGWKNRRVLLTVARLDKHKGHDQMILALDRIRQVVPDVLYAIVGDGAERPFLQELVGQQRLGQHVQFLGEVDDERLVRCYQQCDLFVLPNRQVGRDLEGFGMVLLEAQACAKPVVAGTSGGTAEAIRSPQTGLLVSCDGPHELAALLPELLADRARLERMGVAARQWVAERFDWARLTQHAQELFADLSPAALGRRPV